MMYRPDKTLSRLDFPDPLHGMEEVASSILASSTTRPPGQSLFGGSGLGVFLFPGVTWGASGTSLGHFTLSPGGHPGLEEAPHALCRGDTVALEEAGVGVQRHGRGAVPEHLLHGLDVGPRGDRQRGGRVP